MSVLNAAVSRLAIVPLGAHDRNVVGALDAKLWTFDRRVDQVTLQVTVEPPTAEISPEDIVVEHADGSNGLHWVSIESRDYEFAMLDGERCILVSLDLPQLTETAVHQDLRTAVSMGVISEKDREAIVGDEEALQLAAAAVDRQLTTHAYLLRARWRGTDTETTSDAIEILIKSGDASLRRRSRSTSPWRFAAPLAAAASIGLVGASFAPTGTSFGLAFAIALLLTLFSLRR